MNRLPLLTFSHLRWDFVYQRPQHVMSRLARRRPILFIEEPVHGSEPGFEEKEPLPGLTVLTPRLPHDGPGFGPGQLPALEPMIRRALEVRGWKDHAAWLQTPMAVGLARRLRPTGMIYDCMDELSAFLGAPPALLENEQILLDHADAVLTGGPSLYEAKKNRHPLVRCFPSSVDVAHFANPDAEIPDDLIPLRHPRLGYYGVIDERIDLGVLDTLAAGLPDASIVMIGPVAKIDAHELPRHHNLHYLGARRYDQLPGYAKGWDVCLMPFVIGPATRSISPTKVLEYMAAGRAIVSTPIADVVGPYQDVVHLGEGPAGFLDACRHALAAPPDERTERLRRAARVLDQTSWDRTVERMEAMLDMVISRRRTLEGVVVSGVRS